MSKSQQEKEQADKLREEEELINKKKKQSLEDEELQAQQIRQANQQTLNWQNTTKPTEFKLDSFKAERSALEKVLEKMKETKAIQDWYDTGNGYKTIMKSGKEILMDLNANTVTLNDNSDNSYKTAVQMIRAVGATEVNISNIKNDDDKYRFYKTAAVENLKVSGLDSKLENEFKEKFEKERSEQKSTAPTPTQHK